MKGSGRDRIRVAEQDMVELVRIFLAHMAKCDLRKLCGDVAIERGHRNARK
jgi:hypothetical protein